MTSARRAVSWAFMLLIMASAPAECQSPEAVSITTKDVQIDYCDADADLAMTAIHIKLSFVNRGKKNLILSRDFSPGEPDEYLKVLDESGATVYDSHPSYYPSVEEYNETKKIALEKSPDDKRFEIVRPGASVERDLAMGLPISKDPMHRIGGTPIEGNYRISARRETWPFYSDEDSAKRMRKKWRQYGSLVFQQVHVTGIQVKIALPQNMTSCKTAPAFQPR